MVPGKARFFPVRIEDPNEIRNIYGSGRKSYLS